MPPKKTSGSTTPAARITDTRATPATPRSPSPPPPPLRGRFSPGVQPPPAGPRSCPEPRPPLQGPGERFLGRVLGHLPTSEQRIHRPEHRLELAVIELRERWIDPHLDTLTLYK